jgi:hypothetical protein
METLSVMRLTIYRVLVFALFMLVYTLPSRAQEPEVAPEPRDIPAKIQAGLGLIIGFPVGDFGEQITNPGVGLGGHFGYRIKESPVIIGLDIGYIIYGRESRRERFSLTIPDVTVNVITENNILTTDFLVRLQPREGVFRPYIDGLIGFSYLFTKTSIRDVPEPFGDDVASSVNFDDFAFNYGGGGGFMVRVYDGRAKRTEFNRGMRSVSIDFRIRYLNGSKADYLKRGGVIRQGGNVSLNITRSKTSLVSAFIGAAVEF